MTRQFLVQKFTCAKCGSLLEIESSCAPNYGPYAEGEPTGSSRLEHVIQVHPCECTLGAARDLEMLRNLLRERKA